MKSIGCLAALVLVPTLASAQPAPEPATCGTPMALDDGWQVEPPAAVGLDGVRLCAMAARLQANQSNVHAVVVVRRGKLVFEQYFSGDDDPWGEPAGQFSFDATTKHDMRSVSKSVTSLLVGIAIERRLIAGADEPVLRFFPEFATLKSPGWDSLTLRHLLTMSSGIQWDENRAWTDPKNLPVRACVEAKLADPACLVEIMVVAGK